MPDNGFSLLRLWPDFTQLFQGDFNSAEGLSAMVVALLIVLTGIFLSITIKYSLQAKQQVNFYQRNIRSIQSHQLIKDHTNVSASIQKNSNYKRLWNEFDASLIHDANGQIASTVEAAYFFNARNIAPGLINNRLLAAVPGFLTAIGVLGTFAGLTLGLNTLQLDNQDLESFKSGIFGMISGASIAFMTSVWGVLTSAIFNIIEKVLERSVKRNIEALQYEIDICYPRITTESTLSRIEAFNRSSSTALEGLAEDLGGRMHMALMHTTHELRDAMTSSFMQVLSPAMDKLVDSAHTGFEQSLNTVLSHYVKSMESVSHQQASLIHDAARAQKQLMMEASGEQQAVLKNTAAEVKSTINQVGINIQQAAESQSLLMEKAGLAQIDMIHNAANDVQKTVGQFDQKIHLFVEQLDQHVANLADKSNSTVTELAKKLSAQIDEQHDRELERQKNLDKQVNVLSDNIAQAAEAMSTRVSEVMGTTEKLVNQSIEANTGLQQLLPNLESISHSIESSATALKDAAEQAQEGFQGVDQSFKQLSKQLRKQVEEIDEQVSKLLTSYADQVQSQTLARLNVWNEQTSNYVTCMTDAVKAMNAVVDEIEAKVGSAA